MGLALARCVAVGMMFLTPILPVLAEEGDYKAEKGDGNMKDLGIYRALCIHWDQHPHEGTQLGSGSNAAQIRRYLRDVRPDVTQQHALGAYGYAGFPSEIAAAPSDLVGDPLAIWEQACAEEQVPLGFYLCSFQCESPRLEPRWRCVNREGKVNETNFCTNGPWTEEFFIPLLLEVMVRYHPAHFWLDGAWLPWAHGGGNREDYCYCDHCQRRFQELHGRSLPKEPSAADWADIQDFHERSRDDALARISSAIKQRDSAIRLSVNTAFFFHELRPPIPEVDWLSWDAINTPDLHMTSFEATYLATAGKPGDIMIYENAIMGWSPFSARPRSVEQFKTEAAIILAHGLRVNIWQGPNSDGSISDDKAPIARQVAEFVRERQEWCIDDSSVAEVALLASRLQHLWDPDRQSAATRAAHQLLQEAHIPCDVVREDTLSSRLRQYRLVVLPEISALSQETAKMLRRYVERGGCVLIVATEPLADVPAWLPAILGDSAAIEPTDQAGGVVRQEDAVIHLGGRRFRALGNWEKLVRYEGEDEAWLAELPAGEGRVLAITTEVFSDYATHHWPALRNLVAIAFKEGIGSSPLVEMKGTPGVELVVNRKGDDLYVHLVNLTPGKSFGKPVELLFDEVPIYHKLTLTVRPPRPPETIALLPGEGKVKVAKKGKTLRITVPELQYHVAVKLSGVFER